MSFVVACGRGTDAVTISMKGADVAAELYSYFAMSDPLASLLRRFELRSNVFYAGQMCSLVNFDAQPGAGHLHLLQKGSLNVFGPDGLKTRITQPSLVFFPGPTAHRLGADSSDEASLICASVHFGAEFGNSLIHGLPALLVVPLAEVPSMHRVLELLFEEAFEAHRGRSAALDRLSELMFIHLLRHALDADLIHSGELAGLADARISRAMLAIHEAPERPWQLEELATLAGMSRSRFASHFMGVVGTPPGLYLTNWRLGLAQEMLLRGKQVKAIAEDVGYGSTNALSRAFVARMGVSPREWLSARRREGA